MPLVFVHGVNVRAGRTSEEEREFQTRLDARNWLFRTVSLKGLVREPALLHVENPFWGKYGATFTHNLASLPDPGAETFGPRPDDLMAQVLAETLTPAAAAEIAKTPGGEGKVLLMLARQDPKETFPLAVDAVIASAANRPAGGDEPSMTTENEALASFAALTVTYLNSDPDLGWLFAKRPTTGEFVLQDDGQFMEALAHRVTSFSQHEVRDETFGPGSKILERLKGSARALGQAAKRTSRAVATVAKGTLGAATGAIAGSVVGAVAGGAPGAVVKLLRPGATQRAGAFMGDVFAYLNARGDRDNPGEIVDVVLASLRSGVEKKTANDPLLIVVAHSMGGNIVYDIVTHFDPSISIDLLVTVGSQVALFKEMRLYLEDRGTLAARRSGKAKKPDAVRAWLNVFDPLDVLGFGAEGVFDCVKDYAFSTHANPLDAHSMYFYRMTFHERMRARIAEMGLRVTP